MLAFLGAVLALAASGCADAVDSTGAVPESAKLAPADAVAFATLVTDQDSEQWEQADRLLGLFPEARTELVAELRDALARENLTWENDVAPALGDELVVVVTVDRNPVVLVQPESEEQLTALLAKLDAPVARGELEDWTVLAQSQTTLDTYLAAAGRATLDGVDGFGEAMEGLPEEALLRGWADLGTLATDVAAALDQSGVGDDLDVEWLAVALSAEEDGVHVALGVQAPEGTGQSSYEPELVERVPADAVAVLSFGGTQGLFDRIQGAVPLDEVSEVLGKTIGVSLEGLTDALSGEGALYVRPGGEEMPEVTLVLAPPDVQKAFGTVDRVARRLAQEAGQQVRTRQDGALTVNELTVEGFQLSYARLEDAVIVTTGPEGIDEFLGDGPKLADADGFSAAAERVGLGDRTRGFAYVDIDGLIPFVESVAGSETVPPEARDVLTSLDSLILQADGEGTTTELHGFLRVSG